MSSLSRVDYKVIFALTLVHFTGDLFSSFTTPLFPLFMDKLGLTLTQIGLIAGVNRFLAFIVQPTVGYLADRYPSRGFVLTGLLLPVICIPISGVTWGFWSLLLMIALGSIGSSMFHPSVTGMVPLYSGHKVGFAMSIFNTGGTLAFGVGPLIITWVANRFGLKALPYTMVFGLMVVIYLATTLPVPRSEGMRHLGFWGALKESLDNAWVTVAKIWVVMVLRSVVGQSFLTFMPVLYVQKGYSLVAAGAIFSLFTVAGTLSGLLSGHLSDRIGFKPIFVFTHLLMAPVMLLFLQMEGDWVYLGSTLAGAFNLASLPIGVAMAQTVAPKGRSMVASLMMGFAFGLGGVISPLVGKLADIYSIQSVLTIVALLPLISMPLVLSFPGVKGGGRG